MKTIKVMVVDDHKLVRELITSLLKKQTDILLVGEAASGEEAIKLAREKNPDVILMDIRMPGAGGIHATTRIVAYNPDIKIIALTGCQEDPFPSKMLKVGAKGYLTKGASLEKMVDAIHQVFAGQNYLDLEIAQKLALKNISGSPPSIFDSLTGRELTVMMMIANGTKVEVIAEKLCLSPKTINTCRYRLYHKLKLENDVQLAALALKHDLLD